MSSRFQGLKSTLPTPASSAPPPATVESVSAGRLKNGREGKKAIAGYFSPEVSRGLHLLGLEQSKSLQALLGEAIDDLMRKYGKHPFGER